MKWLRKYDTIKQTWTNHVDAYNDEMARDPNRKMIDDAEAAKCREALAIEKRNAVIARQAAKAKVQPVIIPAMNKAQAKAVEAVVDDPTPSIEDVAEQNKAIDLPPVPEPEVKAPVVAEPVADDLSAMDRNELRKVIDEESLDVPKNLSVAEMLPLVRKARAEKKG